MAPVRSTYRRTLASSGFISGVVTIRVTAQAYADICIEKLPPTILADGCDNRISTDSEWHANLRVRDPCRTPHWFWRRIPTVGFRIYPLSMYNGGVSGCQPDAMGIENSRIFPVSNRDLKELVCLTRNPTHSHFCCGARRAPTLSFWTGQQACKSSGACYTLAVW